MGLLIVICITGKRLQLQASTMEYRRTNSMAQTLAAASQILAVADPTVYAGTRSTSATTMTASPVPRLQRNTTMKQTIADSQYLIGRPLLSVTARPVTRAFAERHVRSPQAIRSKKESR